MGTHTPVPWDVRTLENFGWNVVHYLQGDKFDIVRVAKVNREEDARLIAAAPDLLTALKALLPDVDNEIEQRQFSGNDEYWQGLKALSDAGHAAVAKAEGRPNG